MARLNLTTLLLSLALVLTLSTSNAQAEHFLWRHNESGITLTFPDDWAKAHNQKSDDLVTLQAPGARDYASCRLRRRKDMRFAMYPYEFERSIQRIYFGFEFWQDYVGEYNGTVLHRVLSDRGLLNTIASSADFTFLSSAGPKTLMRGFAFAGLDSDFTYIFECSAEYKAYDKWHPVFKSILKSVKKDMNDSLYDNEKYRAFQDDLPLVIRGYDALDDYR